jgi:hypothetical protein
VLARAPADKATARRVHAFAATAGRSSWLIGDGDALGGKVWSEDRMRRTAARSRDDEGEDGWRTG